MEAPSLAVVAPRLVADDLRGRALVLHAGGDTYTDVPPAAAVPGLPVASETLPNDLTSAIHRLTFPPLHQFHRGSDGRCGTAQDRIAQVHGLPRAVRETVEFTVLPTPPVRPPSTPRCSLVAVATPTGWAAPGPGSRQRPPKGRPPSSYQGPAADATLASRAVRTVPPPPAGSSANAQVDARLGAAAAEQGLNRINPQLTGHSQCVIEAPAGYGHSQSEAP